MATPTNQDDLDAALRTRDRLRDRAAWWEERKGAVLFPSMVLGLALGYALAFVVAEAIGLPSTAVWFGAVVGLLAVGQGVSWYFDPRKLVAAHKRVETLKAQRAPK
jgi:hypothetical protein